MNFFGSGIRKQFIENELKKIYFQFSTEFNDAYQRTEENIKNELGIDEDKNIQKKPKRLNNEDDALNTAREFTHYLRSHTIKVYEQLLRCEKASLKKDSFFVLDKPIICFADVGCGGGTASIALLMLLSNYQKFRLQKNCPIYPVEVNLLGLDPNSHALKIFTRFLEETKREI